MKDFNPEEELSKMSEEEKNQMVFDKTGLTIDQIMDLPTHEKQVLINSLLGSNEERIDQAVNSFKERTKELIDMIDAPDELKQLLNLSMLQMVDSLVRMVSLHSRGEGQFDLISHVMRGKP